MVERSRSARRLADINASLVTKTRLVKPKVLTLVLAGDFSFPSLGWYAGRELKRRARLPTRVLQLGRLGSPLAPRVQMRSSELNGLEPPQNDPANRFGFSTFKF